MLVNIYKHSILSFISVIVECIEVRILSFFSMEGPTFDAAEVTRIVNCT